MMLTRYAINLSLRDVLPWLLLGWGLLALSIVVLVFVVRQLYRLSAETERHNNAILRMERDLRKQRYAIALQAGEGGDQPSGDAQAMTDILRQAETRLGEGVALHTPDQPNSLTGLSDDEVLGFLKKALATNGIAIYQQPLVSLPSRKPRYYEVFSRILVGNEGYIPANKFIAIAKTNNLVNAIDNLLLMQCLRTLKDTTNKEKQAEFFINVTAQTFSSKDYMHNLLGFLSANPQLSSRLIFEMTQKDSLNIGTLARSVMERLALLGCRFSMDQVLILGMDLDRLLDLNISFVKLDMNAMKRDLANTAERKRIKRIKQSLDIQGINVIIEKVENEKQLFNVLDLHFDIGQGYLFGKPEPLV